MFLYLDHVKVIETVIAITENLEAPFKRKNG